MKPNGLLKKSPKMKPDGLNILYQKFTEHFQLWCQKPVKFECQNERDSDSQFFN